MTNVQPQLFTEIATEVRSQFPGTFVTGEWVDAPAQFPCVSIVEADNYFDRSSFDNTLKENLAVLMYQVTVFSNKQTGKRFQCVEILSLIDDMFRMKNAIRIGRTESYVDPSTKKIYQMTARYRVRVKDDGEGNYTFYT